MGNIFIRIYRNIESNRRAWALVLLVLIAACTWTASRIQFKENILDILPKDDNLLRASNTVNDLKLTNRLVIHLYHSDTTIVNPDQLITVSSAFEDSIIARSGSHIKGFISEIPESHFDVLYNYYYDHLPYYLDSTAYAKLENRVQPQGIRSSLESMFRSLNSPVGIVSRKMSARDPLNFLSFPLNSAKDFQLEKNFSLYQNHLLTADRKHQVMMVELAHSVDDTGVNEQLIQNLKATIQSMSLLYPEVQIEYVGVAAMTVANAGRIKADVTLTISLAVIALFLFIALFYRKFGTFFLVMMPALFGGLMGIAALAIFRDSISVIALVVGSVLLGITIDYALHFLTHLKEKENFEKRYADLVIPILMCGLTTACTFFCLHFVGTPVMQDLGIFAGVSVLSAAIFTLVVLPHFVNKSKRIEKESSPNFVEILVEKLANYPLHKKLGAQLIFVVFTIISLFTWGQYEFEEDMASLNYLPDDLATYDANLQAISDISSNHIYVAVYGKNLDEALEANLSLDKKLQELQSEQLISNFLTVNKLIPSPSQRVKRLEEWSAFWSKNPRDSVLNSLAIESSALGFQEGAFSQFDSMIHRPPPTMTRDEVNKLLGLFGDNLIVESGDEIGVLSTMRLPSRNKKQVLELLSQIPDVLILDRGYITTQLVQVLSRDFNQLVNFSLALIFIIVLLSYGRIELAIITFLPILLSWLWVLGLMGLLGLSFNVVNIIICTLLFGLGVDYSIFVLQGLLQEYTYGKANLPSYKKSIILSVATTLIGIGVLAFAQHPALKSIAFLTIIGMLSVVFITFTLQPILFWFLIGRRKKKAVIPFTLSSLLITVAAFSYFVFGCFLLSILRLVFFLPIGSSDQRKYGFHVVMMLFCRSLIYIMFNFKKVIVDRQNITYSKPSVIIANHHSFVDILVMLMFHPKVVMVTNDWVYHSPFFGIAVRYADFIPASRGLENQVEKIKKLVDKGFSILVYPEGSRSSGFDLGRFHKGAFFIADYFKLDIQPIIMHGFNMVMQKGDDFYLKNSPVHVKFLPRISHQKNAFGSTYQSRAKSISKYVKSEYALLRKDLEKPTFFHETIIKNFLYKGPVLEWYLRVKLRLEGNYELFHTLIPQKARIVDLGCGYGFLDFALAYSSADRQILGIDYDANKIEIAQNVPVLPVNLSFMQGDITSTVYGSADVIVINDVLHYLLPNEQSSVLDTMVENLNPDGMIIIRDGDSTMQERHKGTKLTEVFSTGMGFNKTRNKLNFISSDLISSFADRHNLTVRKIDITKNTSNLIFVLKRID